MIEANGRAFYPVLTTGKFGQLASEVFGDRLPELPSLLQVFFLFTGNQPLNVTVFTPEPHEFVLTPAPARRPREYDMSLARWWRTYNAFAREQQRKSDYPPLIHSYLTSMLSQRLKLRSPLLTRIAEPDQSEVQQTMGLLFGTEELRYAVLRETMRGDGLGEVASLPMSPEVVWQPLSMPSDAPPVEVEPIAQHVPQECFYLRFGSFTNYLWFDHLKDDYGGDISRMVTLRGHNARLDERVQRQLALKQTALAEVMGPTVISDVALIGRDLYLKEGAALGILFEASNSALVGVSLASDRQTILQERQAERATLKTLTIAGHEVSLLSTPDNQLRSFYAVDGDYHLVTTSQSMVEEFYVAGRGQGSLGTSAEFQHARVEMPLSREDTIFAYFSSAFFRSLLSPQYQIELSRRLQSITDMELVQLAQLAALSEGCDHETIEDLIAGGFLPQGFGQRGDRGPLLITDHGFIDPLRGARGTFTPIPDMPLSAITPTESELFNRCAQFLQDEWQQMDPLMIGIKRYALEQERHERVVVDAHVSPLVEKKYGWMLSMIGPPSEVRIESNPNDAITVQMSLRGGLLWPDIPAHQLFLSVRDVDPGVNLIPGGFLKPLQILRMTPGYLGAWPKLGLLDLIPILTSQPDVLGFSSLPLGLWRWQGGGFSVLSFHRRVLEEASAHLQPVPTENMAQIRIRISDLAHSQLASWITMLNFSRAYQVSHGNVLLLQSLSQQLRVSQPQALDLANRLLDTQLVCALDGEYELVEDENGTRKWWSTAWPESLQQMPSDYAAPLLKWFRGASVDLTKVEDRMLMHVELDMLRKESEPEVQLPTFNLFDGK
ncbi:MAG: hypothetical protein R3C02_25365 [Planctomycetaceae bacterium]